MQARPEIHEAIAALQRLTELFTLRRRQLAGEVGLTESQWSLLEEVADVHFLPSLFAQERECTPAAVSRGLRALLDQRLVVVEIDPSDGRQRRYRLTAEGKRVLRNLRRGRERAIAAIWQDFDAPTLGAFVHFADELSDQLAAYAGRGATSRETRASASR
ncbi:MAG: MarR family transcriptional regulator [Myxococcota bacterium]